MYKKLNGLFKFILSVITGVLVFTNISPVFHNVSAQDEKVLRWNVGQEPNSLDPMLMGQQAMQVVNNTFEGLMRTVNNEVVPATAESYDVSEDGTVYTFYIREDAKWSDGEPVTADDYKFAWIRFLDPEMQRSYASEFFMIKNAEAYFNGEVEAEEVGIKVVDDKTLEVELVSPTPFFLSLLAFNVYYPVREDIVDPEGAWSINPETAISNGPFKLIEYNLNENLVLGRNENYWDAESVKLDKIEVSFISDAASAMTAFRNDELDIFKDVSNQEVAQLMASDPEFHMTPYRGMQFYIFNVNHEALSDVNVRKALSMAVDRTAIVENVTKGGQKPGAGLVPHGIHVSTGEEFRETVDLYEGVPIEANVEEAQKLMEEAGYPNGEGFPQITLTINDSGEHPTVAETIVQMWKENLNIDCEIQVVDSQSIGEIRNTGNFDIVRWGWSADYDDPYNFLGLFISTAGRDYGGYTSEEFDDLISQSMTAQGEERDQLLRDAESILFEDMPILPQYELVNTSMIKEKVVDWDLTGFAHWYFGNTDIVE